MFLPLDRKPDWRNPPLITLIILVINVLFWYIWQTNDEKYSVEASEYYVYSGLYKTELRKYEEYLNSKDKLTEMDIDRFSRAAQKLTHEMQKDGEFQNKLDADTRRTITRRNTLRDIEPQIQPRRTKGLDLNNIHLRSYTTYR